jgi:intracellular septation protein A
MCYIRNSKMQDARTYGIWEKLPLIQFTFLILCTLINTVTACEFRTDIRWFKYDRDKL